MDQELKAFLEEQFARAKQETAEQFARVNEQLAQVDERFAQMDGRFAQVDERFAQMDGRFAQVDERFAQMDERFAQMDERFAQMDERFAQMDERFAQMDGRFAQMDGRFAQVDERFSEVQEKIHLTQVAVEGVRGDIRMVAEGVMGVTERLETFQAETARNFQEVMGLRAPVFRELGHRITAQDNQIEDLHGRIRHLEARAERQTKDVYEAIQQKFGRPQDS